MEFSGTINQKYTLAHIPAHWSQCLGHFRGRCSLLWLSLCHLTQIHNYSLPSLFYLFIIIHTISFDIHGSPRLYIIVYDLLHCEDHAQRSTTWCGLNMGRETRRIPRGRGIFELEGLRTTGARAEDDNIVTAAVEPV